MSENKKKRGKVLSVSLDEQKSEFVRYEDQLKDKDLLPPPSSKIFLDIRKNLSCRMSVKAIYLSLKKNFDYFFNNTVKQRSSPEYDDNLSSEEFDSPKSSVQDKYAVENFEISLSDWQNIKPVTSYCSRTDKDRPSVTRHKKTVLPQHKWTNVMSEILWKETKRECTWIFKRSSAVDYNIRFSGYCKQCGAKIRAESTEASETHAKIKCIIEVGDLNIVHDPKIKNKLTKKKKEELSEKLINEHAIVIRNKIVNKVMNEDDTYEPPFVPSLKALQNIRHRSKHEAYLDKNVVLSLWIMGSTLYKNVIRLFCVLPFILYYWTDLQEKYYCHLVNCNKRIKLSIDATGSIFKKINPPRDPAQIYVAKHIFLYVAVLQTGNSCVPVTQMITDLHTLENIYKWLKQWIGTKKTPDEVVCDDSAALVGAIIKAFTDFESTKDYIAYCFDVLMKKEKIKTNHCLIRLDTSHFVKTLYNYQCFKHVDERVMKFYIKYICKIKDSSSFGEIKLIMENLIVIALNRYTGKDSNGHPTLCNQSLQKLLQTDTDNTNRENEDDDEVRVNEEVNTIINDLLNSEEIENVTSDFMKEFTMKVDKVSLELQLSEIKTIYENLYYLPDFINTFKRLMSRLPIWANVMLSFVYTENVTSTSSDVESYFKNIKTLLKNPNDRLRVDEFLMKHHEYISGDLKNKFSDDISEQKTKATEKAKVESSDFSQESVMSDEPILLENWRGLAIGKQEKQKREMRSKNKSVDVLVNGSSSSTGIKGVVVENTCAFDCLVQSLAVAYIDRMNIRKLIETKTSGFMTLIKSLANKDPTNLYSIRANIINKYYFDKTITNVLTIINCMSNITFVLDKILLKDIPIVRSEKRCTNTQCSQNNSTSQRVCSYMPLNELILSDKGISALEESAQTMLEIDSGVLCDKSNDDGVKCTGKQIINYTLNDLLIFEIDLGVDLNDIPDTMTLQGKLFTLLSVIEYLPNIRHYVAHCKRLDDTWETYDDLSTKATRTKNQQMNVHCILYANL